MKEILNALYHQKDLNDGEVKKLFTLIVNEKVSPAQLGTHFMRFKNQGREL